MKRLIYFCLFALVFVSCKPLECGWTDKPNVHARFQDWLQIRAASESSIIRVKSLTKWQNDPNLKSFIGNYNKNCDELNSLVDEVKSDLKSKAVDNVIDAALGNRLLLKYQSRYEQNIKQLSQINLQMDAFYKNKTGQAVGGAGLTEGWKDILALILKEAFKDLQKEFIKRESKKLDCLKFKKYGQIKG